MASAVARTAKRRFSVGLTGGIGCGKTTVANMFAALGASVIDTDDIAHSLSAPNGAAMPAILDEFGAGFVTAEGALDRAAMRALVFSDSTARHRLEAILHPRIRDAADAAAASATGVYLIYVVPLLIESGSWAGRVDRILAVDCAEQVQIARVMARNGMQEPQVRAIMATQVTRAQRLAAAHDVVVNDGGLDALGPQIASLHEKYLGFSERMARFPLDHL